MNALRPLALVLCLAACGDGTTTPAPSGNGNTLSGTSPYPAQFAMGQAVRNLVLRVETRVGGVATAQQCGYSFVLFDAMRASTQTPTLTDSSGDCKLYMAPPESEYTNQRWVCAGGINTESGALMQVSGFCPQMGAAPPWEGNFRDCGALVSSREASVSSGDEIGPDDQVTDLAGTVRFPTTVEITAPTTFTVTTWPAAGDLVVAWSSAQATSAVVRIEPDTATRTGPTILCTPRINGTVRVEAALIDRANLRAADARLRVSSYRETAARAENHAWNLVGAMSNSVLLQPAR